MKLVHDSYGETVADSQREVNRLAQYGWRVAPEAPSEPQPEPEKPSRKRKPVEEQPELPIDSE